MYKTATVLGLLFLATLIGSYGLFSSSKNEVKNPTLSAEIQGLSNPSLVSPAATPTPTPTPTIYVQPATPTPTPVNCKQLADSIEQKYTVMYEEWSKDWENTPNQYCPSGDKECRLVLIRRIINEQRSNDLNSIPEVCQPTQAD